MISSKIARNLGIFLRNNSSGIRQSSFGIRFASTESSEFTKINTNSEAASLNPDALSEISEIKTFSLDKVLKNVNPDLTLVRQAWVESMSTPSSVKVGLLELHPQVFSAFPRPDIIQKNFDWQVKYKHVNWLNMPTRAEVRGANKKPWPQKGLGKARHGSRKSPQWIRGGWAHGPRGPRTYFFMLPWPTRVAGLISMLSLKYSQDDIKIVDSFEDFPRDGTLAHVEELCETRGWGPSVLFVDKMDIEDTPKATKSEHFENAMKNIPHINILPVYSLNVFTMLKHETLVLTVDAAKHIQDRLLFQLNRIDLRNVVKAYKPDGVYRL